MSPNAGKRSRVEGDKRIRATLLKRSVEHLPEVATGHRPVRCRWRAIQDRTWPTVSGMTRC
jgi:hypothetical protein